MIGLEDIRPKKYAYTDKRAVINKASSMKTLQHIMWNNPGLDWSIPKKDLEECIEKLKASNFRRLEKEIYKTNGYSDESLEYNDNLNNGEVLIINPPYSVATVADNTVKNLTIGEIKADLKYVLANGKNYFLSRHYEIGKAKLMKIVEAIGWYEDQIARQGLLTSDRDINLFELNYDEKLAIVLSYYEDIVNFFTKDKKDLIWQDYSANQNKLLIESLSAKGARGRNTKEVLSNYIANYTTIEELEKFKKGNVKVLNRFVR